MQDIFPRESAVNPEPFTGERLTGDIHGQVEIEHYHRYLYARMFCGNKDVLDVASGEGYGAAQLAQVARSAVGVEFSRPTVRNAVANFPRLNLRFVNADARVLPLRPAAFDVVTSFETIEHFDHQEAFVAEVHRVLRPDGMFIVSTPDRDIYNGPGSVPNPYHVKEFDRAEFLALLHKYFGHVILVRQRPVVASALVPEGAPAHAPWIFERHDDQSFVHEDALPKAPYLVALASNVLYAVPPVSLFIERSDLDDASLQAEIARARQAVDTARGEAAAAREEADEARADTARIEEDMRKTLATLAITRSALVEANTERDHICGSLRHFLPQYLPKLWRHFFR